MEEIETALMCDDMRIYGWGILAPQVLEAEFKVRRQSLKVHGHSKACPRAEIFKSGPPKPPICHNSNNGLESTILTLFTDYCSRKLRFEKRYESPINPGLLSRNLGAYAMPDRLAGLRTLAI